MAVKSTELFVNLLLYSRKDIFDHAFLPPCGYQSEGIRLARIA
jgi:hypothetical protein